MAGVLEKFELAIIIPVVNCLAYTKKLILTIKTKHPHKLILIDNGSTDGTRSYFWYLAQKKLAHAVFFKDNKGVAGSWNFGIRTAIKNYDSRYFLILNNDILLHPEAVDVLLDTLEAQNVALVSATDVSGRVVRFSDVLGLPLPKKTLFVEAPEFSCFMVKKETILKVGYFDEKFYPGYFEDNDYHYRINLACQKAVKTNRALYFHFGSRTIRETEEIRVKSNLAYLPNRDYYSRKWGGKPGEEKFLYPFNGKL